MSACAAWVLATVAGALTPEATPAQGTDRVTLDWQAPDACPSQAQVRRDIEALLAEAGSEDQSPAAVTGRVTVDQAGTYTVALTLQIEGEQTERVIDGDACGELASAASFIVATAIDPRVATLPPPPSAMREPVELDAAEPESTDEPGPEPEPEPEPAPAEPEPEPEPAPSGPVRPPPPDDVSDRPPRSLRAALGPLVGVGFGPTPSANATVGVSASLLGRRFRVDLVGTYWTPNSGSSRDDSEITVRVQAWDIVVRGCGVPQVDRFEFPLCGGVGAGALHGQGQGQGLARSGRATAAWIRATAGPGLLVRLTPRLAVGARADGSVTLASSAFRTEPSGVLHRPRSVGVTGTAHIEFRLP